MNLLTPLSLFFALLAVPIILLYLLRLQRREQPVSSTLLWRQVTMDREANTLWQKLRKNLLLLLQLLTLLFLVFALIRPYINVASELSGRTVLLIDSSASMLATDVAPSRFEAARTQVRNLINQIGTNDQMTLIAVDADPRALSTATNDRTQLLNSLDTLQASLGQANWSAAIALAAASNGGNLNNATVVVISDGAHADDLKLLNAKARYISIGQSGDNIAISTFALRRTLRGISALVRLSNTGTQDDQVLVSLQADGNLVDAKTLSLPAGQSATWTINNLDSRVQSLRASIDKANHNTLAADDVAYAVNTNNAGRRALLITRGNRFLEQALSALPNLRTTRSLTMPTTSEATYDLYVIDSVSVTLPANANALLIGPQTVFTTSGIFSNTGFSRVEQHPIMQSVDWRSINVLDAQRVNVPSWLRPMVQSQGGPLLYAGENPNNNQDSTLRRIVLLPFELRKSDLPLQIAFPVLMANSVEWLAPPQGLNIPTHVKPGEIVAVPENTLVRTPNNQLIPVDRRGFAQTQEPGVYQLQSNNNEGVRGAFAVNFSNPSESDITPNPSLQIGSTPTPTDNRPQLTQREFWGLMAALALLLLIAEWWVYQRGLPAFARRKEPVAGKP